MTLTVERAKQISDALMQDKEEALKYLEMEPAAAAVALNAKGNDFTEEELVEYCESVKSYFAQGELKEENLDDVVGGLGVFATVGIACGIAFGAGLGVGALEHFNIW